MYRFSFSFWPIPPSSSKIPTPESVAGWGPLRASVLLHKSTMLLMCMPWPLRASVLLHKSTMLLMCMPWPLRASVLLHKSTMLLMCMPWPLPAFVLLHKSRMLLILLKLHGSFHHSGCYARSVGYLNGMALAGVHPPGAIYCNGTVARHKK
jgi:hypothetical protein